MNICGVEISANDAVVSLLSLSKGVFTIRDCRVAKVSISDANDTQKMRDFQFSFAKLMQDYQIDKVVIRQRPMKGKFAGGAVGFKLEAAIQLIDGLAVEVVPATDIKERLKRNPLTVPFKETGLKQYQEPAFMVAYACIMSSNG
jgi:hypothetical protein